MEYQKTQIKEGVTLHVIETNKFKTNVFSVFLATPMDRKTVTYNALLAAILRRGSRNYQRNKKLQKN